MYKALANAAPLVGWMHGKVTGLSQTLDNIKSQVDAGKGLVYPAEISAKLTKMSALEASGKGKWIDLNKQMLSADEQAYLENTDLLGAYRGASSHYEQAPFPSILVCDNTLGTRVLEVDVNQETDHEGPSTHTQMICNPGECRFVYLKRMSPYAPVKARVTSNGKFISEGLISSKENLAVNRDGKFTKNSSSDSGQVLEDAEGLLGVVNTEKGLERAINHCEKLLKSLDIESRMADLISEKFEEPLKAAQDRLSDIKYARHEREAEKMMERLVALRKKRRGYL